jgi:amino acid transporter
VSYLLSTARGTDAVGVGNPYFLGLPLPNVVSVVLIGLFVVLNLVGVSETGKSEDVLTFVKVTVIAIFGGMSYLAFAKRDELDLLTPLPVVGMAGTALFFPLLLYDLYINSPDVFGLVLVIAVLVVGVELLYFEREPVGEVPPWMGRPDTRESTGDPSNGPRESRSGRRRLPGGVCELGSGVL